MREVILDARPKWQRRLSLWPRRAQAVIILTALFQVIREFVLFPSECRDAWFEIVEEIAGNGPY
ncbi:MAG: hypothetical protein ACLQF0_05485 [Dissulfurispiraceae bacterium]